MGILRGGAFVIVSVVFAIRMFAQHPVTACSLAEATPDEPGTNA